MSQKSAMPMDEESKAGADVPTEESGVEDAGQADAVVKKKKPAAKRRASSTDVKEGDGPKKKKDKRDKDPNAPKAPLNGYVHFLNSRRDQLRGENPEMIFADVTKELAIQWKKLTDEEKEPFQEEARRDKERHGRELEEYMKTESYRLYQQSVKDKKNKPANEPATKKSAKEKVKGSKVSRTAQLARETADAAVKESSSLDIPIFTEDFLEHNKTMEGELRRLRKNNVEFEESNAILSKHCEDMQAEAQKFQEEIKGFHANNQEIGQFLDLMKAGCLKSFGGLTIPGTNETIDQDNVEEYMTKLHEFVMKHEKGSNNKENEFIERIRAAASQVDRDSIKHI